MIGSVITELFPCGTLTFSSWSWIGPLLGVVCLALAALVWSYAPARQAGRLRWWCLGLKLIGFVALALCLLEPLWLSPHARQGANFFAVVADNSQGLQVKETGSSRSRGEVLTAALGTPSTGWQRTLADTFEVRR
ncbi:MAG TPA: hypothetical protein PLN52_02575, partial [Opitutaceae bacterium]|nr:hypothetical protein [Opitutaceae bacterium]